MDKEIRGFVEEAERQGWKAEVLRTGHIRLYAPDGVGIVGLSGTPGDSNWKRIAISRMKRHGLVWPPTKS